MAQQTKVVTLQGSRCNACGTVAFPVAQTCRKCTSKDLVTSDLSRDGIVWAHTVQRFRPKSPPYVEPETGFEPFAVGYVELPDGIKVEAILESSEDEELHGAEVELIATQPVPRFATASVVRKN